MKIFLVTNALPLGGIEKNIVRLTREFSLRGHSVVVVSQGGVLEEDVVTAGGKHIRVETSPRYWPRSVKKMRNVLCEERADIVHAFSASAAMLLWLTFTMCSFSLPRDKPVVVSSIMGIKSSQDESFITSMFRAFLTTLGAKKILIISPEIAKTIHKLPIARERLIEKDVVGVELPAPPEKEELHALRGELGVAEDERIVTTIGRLNSTKSHELFVAAAAKVLNVRKDVHFYIIGEGETRSCLAAAIDELGLDAHIHLLGARKDISNLLSISDVYVRPGIVEGFVGITVLEAQSLKIPVISFDNNDVRVAIQDGVTGGLVPLADTSALAEKIILFLKDKNYSTKIAENGYEHVKSIFSVSAVAEGLLGLYEELRR